MRNKHSSVRYAIALAVVVWWGICLCACTQTPSRSATSPSDLAILPSPVTTTKAPIANEHPSGSTTTSATSVLPTTSAVTTQPPVSDTSAVTTTPPIPDPPPILPDEPEDAELVLLSEYLPRAILDIRYATTQNFTGQIIYEEAAPRLRYGTVKKLRTVCEKLEEQGLSLVIWDAWRPAAAQWKLWNICPDPTYVSDPTKGYSSHTKGGTVDITLAYADGTLVEMPTDFDDFSKAADLDFSDVSPDAAANATLLQQLMKECGFRPYRAEWWHFSDTEAWEVIEKLPM